VRAYVVWTGALLVYTVSVMQRTTFGVAGMAAVDRFEAPPALLSAFVFLQVAVYLALQVPAGLLLDRFGSRALLCVGSLVMAVGQGALALAVELPQAFLARTVVGAGDALIFVAALAIIPRWFAARTVPLLTQLTAMTGQVGQILSALPLLAVLNVFGWFSAFGPAALMGILAALLSWIVVRNAPADHWRPQPATSAREVLGILKVVWLRLAPGWASSLTWAHSSRESSSR